HALAIDVGPNGGECTVLVHEAVPDVHELAADLLGHATIDVVEGEHVGRHGWGLERWHAHPQQWNAGSPNLDGEPTHPVRVFGGPGIGADLLAVAVDGKLLAVVGADHHDDDGRLHFFDDRTELGGPVVEVVPHKAGGPVGSRFDAHAGRLRVGVVKPLGKTGGHEVANHE